MATCYQTDGNGYLLTETDDFGGFLPAGAVYDPPSSPREGFIPRWTGTEWIEDETHKGRAGYLDGQPHTIFRHGPLPDGWSDTPPPPMPPTPEYLAASIRAERDRRIAACDYLMIPDYPLSPESRAAWEAYRQALRDVPSQDGFPNAVVWPEPPASNAVTE
jgi:hypothetical protein